MISKGNYFNGEWRSSNGVPFSSVSPVDSSVLWNGNNATSYELNECISAACSVREELENTPIETRYALGSNVRRDEVQNYVGAVAGTPSKKASLLHMKVIRFSKLNMNMH